jgi:hypothetical protein
MDQSTPEEPTPDPTAPMPEPAAPSTAAAPTRDERIETRLQSLVGADDPVVAWTRAWVSRETPVHRLLAARTLDFAVVTERYLFLYSIGFFTRRARRRVYESRIDRIVVNDDPVSRGRRLRVTARQVHPLWIELRDDERSRRFADAVVARTRIEEQ